MHKLSIKKEIWYL